MGINSRKRAADGKSVEIYLNSEMRRAINTIQENRREAGEDELSDKQFVKLATVEKIKRDLDVDIRLPLRESRRDLRYHVTDEEEIEDEI